VTRFGATVPELPVVPGVLMPVCHSRIALLGILAGEHEYRTLELCGKIHGKNEKKPD
jgi:hypothetical protein